ncbi:MAG: ABC transporter ATP-binding protein [Phycisphaerales bacterium]
MSAIATVSSGRFGVDPDLAIDLAHVAKTYRGRVQALRGITMQVSRGAVFGLLGPNGAGKSTLVKIMLTIISPTRCDGTMLGRPIGDKSVLGRVGYLPEHHRFPDYLTAAQVLDYYASLAKVPRGLRRKRAPELLELVGLSDWTLKKVKGFSKGMRQRLGIANALMHDPDLVVLDEPTDGVDPVGRRDIRNILQHLKAQGKTIFLNSHLLSELEMVCDQVAILVQGLVSAQGTIDDLTRDSRRYEIDFAPPPAFSAASAATTQLLVEAVAQVASVKSLPPPPIASPPPLPVSADPPGPVTPPVPMNSAVVASGTLNVGGIGIPIHIQPTSVKVSSDDASVVQPLIDILRARGFTIKAVRPVRASLEDLFMQAVTDQVTGKVLSPGAIQGRAGTPSKGGSR